MIEQIIFIVLTVFSTEVYYFKCIRGKLSGFAEEKLLSIVSGVMTALFLFGLPWAFATNNGYMAYVWFYSVIGAIALFLGINYKIHKHLEKKEKAAKRAKKKKRKKK